MGVALLGVCAGLLLSSCGGGSRQDASEHKAAYPMRVVGASFPSHQSMARPEQLELRVHNAGQQTVPNVAVTVDSFAYTSTYPQLAANQRPVWVVEQGPGAGAPRPVQSQAISAPGGGQTAYVNTWALGPLAAKSTKTFVWHVVPVKAGSHTVHYTVSAGLAGRATARLASGGPVSGKFTAEIAPTPPPTHVDPSTGQVVPGKYPAQP